MSNSAFLLISQFSNYVNIVLKGTLLMKPTFGLIEFFQVNIMSLFFPIRNEILWSANTTNVSMFIYIYSTFITDVMKCSGLDTEPCGTQQVTFKDSDSDWPICSNCCLIQRSFFILFFSIPLVSFYFCSIILCPIVSKPFSKSVKIQTGYVLLATLLI